jgi:GcrA cell cycle regulator
MKKSNPSDYDWTDGAIARLTELWLAGITSGEISRHMGVSRSAVMGKLRRLDLLCRDRPQLPSVRLPLPPAQKSSNFEQPPEKAPNKRNKRHAKTPDRYFLEFAAKPPPPSPPEPAYGTLNLLDLRHNSCRWPEGERPHYRFCGRPRHHENSYCETHSALAYNRGSQRDYDRAAGQALAGKLFSSRAGIEQ